ncbi:TonB-dependent receptor [Chitinophagaceae bacterium LB-8]|uniref:TonB-dependent receptor n=1 Tax=Paraflavisolibacter caeni TaxID=2982496 RepID=A0A9X3BGZ7_9BACT|nr:TonB-dependent receptor [Paraflavisolibacter caeni]MCU7548243.1 TonB-dependent receptor [Paraflavisolibacter caeni]
MKRNTNIVWVGLLCLFSLGVQAQSILVKGRVSSEGKALPNATVSANTQKIISDSSGFFQFKLPEGKQTLHITVVGYEPYHKVAQFSEHDTSTLLIDLKPSNAVLGEVVITGTMRAVQKLESPIAVEVYNPQFFKKNPAPSVFEALQNVNGVRPQINCSVCNTGDIHINGLEGPYTMVTIDGMPIVSSLSSVYGLFGIPSQMIEQVEIVKGPASGLYGSEAVGGLINIITKSPEKAPLFSANVMSTSWREHSVDLGFRWKMDKISSLLGVNYFNYQNPEDRNGDNFTDVTLQHRISVFNKWSLQRKFNRMATIAARYFYEDRWGGEMQWNKDFRGSNQEYGESIYTGRWELIGNYQLPVMEKLMFSFSATAHDQNSYYGTTPYMGKQKIVFGQLVWDKELLPMHNFLVGAAGRYNYYDDNSTATIDTLTRDNRPEKYFLPGVFVQDEWKLDGNKVLLLGMRYDHHPVHKAILTPRFAFKWSLDEKQVLRMNTGTGFRVVNLFTEEHAALTGARSVEIKEALKPEKSYNVNLNYSRQLGNHSNRFNLDVSAWYSYFYNQIIADYNTDPQKIIYDNLHGHALSKGFTLNLDMNIQQRLKGNLGFTYLDVAKIERNGSGKKVKERPMLTERWSGTWALTYNFPSPGITLDYTGNVYGPMRLPLINALDPRRPNSEVWSIQNIQVTKWISRQVEAFGGIKNLLNWTPAKNNPFIIARAQDPFDKKVEYHTDGSVRASQENPYALTFDPSYVYAPNQGLRFFAGVRVNVK